MQRREAQDAGMEARLRIGTPLSDRIHALLSYHELLRSRQRPCASPDETKMDGRSSDMDDRQACQFTRKSFERELLPPLGRWYRSIE